MKKGPWAELTEVVCYLYYPDSTGCQGLHTAYTYSVSQGGDSSHCSVNGVEGTSIPSIDAEED